jgi:outer membrane protein assembly factor BamB
MGAALVAFAFLNACGGSHGAGQSTLPALPSAKVHAAAAAAGTDVVALDSGGAAAGSFAADADFTASGTWTYKTTAAIDTSLITSSAPAPQAVYQSEREGAALAYTIPGLTAGATYTVRLSFAELWWTAAGQRSFNVSINNANVLTGFDVFATTGARYKAVAESFTATANAAGAIAIKLTAVKDNAALNAIEIVSGGATPAPTPVPTPTPTAGPGATVAINSGGTAVANFAADKDVATNGTWTSSTTSAIDTTGVTNPVPQAVDQSQRVGAAIAYTIPGLTAGAAYTVRLDFAELWWTSNGQRLINVSINNTSVLSNLDIFAVAGARYKAVAETFNATASATGTIAITLTAAKDYAAVNAVQIGSGSGAPPTPTPTPPATAFNDYPTFGYDNQRDVFNPNSTAITPANLSKLHVAWQASLNDYNTLTQPVLATAIPGYAGVLYVGGGSGNVYGYDALKGTQLWKTPTGQTVYSACGGTSYFGVGGTAAYDPASKSLYIVGNSNPATDAYAANQLFRLDGATGSILGRVNFAPAAAGSTSELNFTHTAVALSNGVAYVGTGSTCDISSWRGTVAAISVPSMTVTNRFFTLWDPQNTRGAGNQPWGGGGVWGWGGVALDYSGNLLTGVGNADNGLSHGTISAPFVTAPQEYSGYGETLLELSSNISSVVASNHPIPVNIYSGSVNDLDVQGTPLVVRPNGAGCGTMVALQGKSGEFSVYNESLLGAGLAAQYQLSPTNSDDAYLGDPAYSPATGLIYAPVASSTSPSLFAPGLIAINPGCGKPSVTWHAGFGSDSSSAALPRAVPAVSAGGVVFAGTVNGSGGDLWAVDASTGTVLNGGTALLHTSAHLRVPPTIDGNWVFVIDNSGDMYGLTIDPAFAAIQTKYRAPDPRSLEQSQRFKRR